MSYKIIVRNPSYQRRSEEWDGKTYATRDKAIREIERARTQADKSRYLKTERNNIYKVVKLKDKIRQKLGSPYTINQLLRM